jgi:hypothetical protein
MIGWLFDRWWAWKNRDALRQIDDQMDWLRREGERLHERMVEMYGPDYRAQMEERLQARLSGRYTTT